MTEEEIQYLDYSKKVFDDFCILDFISFGSHADGKYSLHKDLNTGRWITEYSAHGVNHYKNEFYKLEDAIHELLVKLSWDEKEEQDMENELNDICKLYLKQGVLK